MSFVSFVLDLQHSESCYGHSKHVLIYTNLTEKIYKENGWISQIHSRGILSENPVGSNFTGRYH